jgi:hypothetical protein
VRSPSGNALRHDPRKIYDIHVDRDTGLTTAEIAAKHDLSAITVQTLLRAAGQGCGLTNPYGFRRGPLPSNAAVQMYWLGYIAACGRVFGQGAQWTLMLAIHPDDEGHIHTLLRDLVVGHARIEFADSNLDGRQAYVRERQLVEMLLQWGIAAAPEVGSISLEFMPPALASDLVRGFLEGSRLAPPFGRSSPRIPSPRSVRSLALVGHPSLLEDLGRLLHSVCGTRTGSMEAFGSTGLAQLTFSPEDSLAVLGCAYQNPVRTGPRAAKFVARFAPPKGGSGPLSPRARPRHPVRT